MMNRIASSIVILSVILLVSSTSGCGRRPPSADKSPVAEVAVADSGVRLSDVSHALSKDDWPAWRGSSQLGIASGQDLPTQWDETTNIRWKADVPGRGHGSPIIVGDAVFLATAIESKSQQRVLCYSKATGEVQWDEIVHSGGFPSANEVHKKGSNANSTLASDGELLFAAFFNSGKIIATALDMTGQQVWQREVGSFGSKFGYAPSPILYQSFVIIAADNWGGGYLAALDAKTGEIAWRVARGEISTYSSPMIANIGGRDQLIISGCGAVTSYDPANGQQLWRTECIAEATCGTAVTDGESIFASGGYPDKETVCLSADGEKRWSNNTKVYEPSIIVDADHVFAITDDGIAVCFDASSGEALWRKRLGGNFSASPILASDRIYASNLSGETFVFKAAADGYHSISTNQLGSDCYASPAVSDGQIFLRIGTGLGDQRHETLVCIANN
tara:strand:- start:659543 stop:660883 length:1341 start_codon:yes stop_codon:yes gene_type:complete